jgi:hypothetical protein
VLEQQRLKETGNQTLVLKINYKENAGNVNNMAQPNPNGANGIQSDPREQVCWDFYIKGIQENRENAYKAAIDAGYAVDTARNITMNDWFKERLGKLKRKEMFSKAERNLDFVLDMEVEEEGKINPQLLKIKTDVSTTIAKTLGKQEGYSERTELTGAQGKDLTVNVIQYGNHSTSQLLSEGISATPPTSD